MPIIYYPTGMIKEVIPDPKPVKAAPKTAKEAPKTEK